MRPVQYPGGRIIWIKCNGQVDFNKSYGDEGSGRLLADESVAAFVGFAAGEAAGAALSQGLQFLSRCPLKDATVPVSRWGSPTLNPGDWVMKGKATPWNYLMSGKYQPKGFPTFGQPPNIPAPYSSGITYNVPPSSISFPSGPLGPVKGLMGQRIYKP